MKKIYFYYTPLCPRSYFSLMNLKKEIKASDFEVEVVKKIFIRFYKKTVLPPCIVLDDKTLNGFFLTRSKINNFLKTAYE